MKCALLLCVSSMVFFYCFSVRPKGIKEGKGKKEENHWSKFEFQPLVQIYLYENRETIVTHRSLSGNPTEKGFAVGIQGKSRDPEWQY